VKRVAALLLAALALSACRVDITTDVDVRADGSGSITVTVVADAEVVERAPGLADDLRTADAEAAGWSVDGPTATDDGGLRVVLSHDFANVEQATALLASVNGPAGPLQSVVVSRDDSDGELRTELSGSLRVDGGLASFADPDVLALLGGATPYADAIADAGLSPAEAVAVKLQVTMPGEIESVDGAPLTSGTVDGATVTWSVPFDGSSIDVATTSVGATGERGVWGVISTVLWVLAAVWLLLGVGFIAWVWWARRRRATKRLSSLG
jgi:hypothetical protein